MRQRPKLEYRQVLRGEERLKMAALLHCMRFHRNMTWKQITEATGVSAAKGCTLLKQYDLSEYEKYMTKE